MTLKTEAVIPDGNRREPFTLPNAATLKLAFIVWGPPSHGPRSQVLARELGIKSLYFIRAGSRRGIWSAPFRYAYQALKTVERLVQERPHVVFVQSPPSLAVLTVFLYSRMTGASYLIDAHSAALLQRIWMWPQWLHRVLLRGAITTLVTNDYFAAKIRADGGQALVLRDVPSQFAQRVGEIPGFSPARDELSGALSSQKTREPGILKGISIAVVNTFSDDEPLDAILAAARELPDVDWYITGNTRQARSGILEHAPANAHFTGFLPEADYYGLLAKADAVMCLTTREHTMQRGACEALSLGKPIITSDTQLLREYFERGAVHVSNQSESICQGVQRLRSDRARYQAEILELRNERRREWQAKEQELVGLIRQAVMTRGFDEWQP